MVIRINAEESGPAISLIFWTKAWNVWFRIYHKLLENGQYHLNDTSRIIKRQSESGMTWLWHMTRFQHTAKSHQQSARSALDYPTCQLIWKVINKNQQHWLV
jgi:hypothetical protein